MRKKISKKHSASISLSLVLACSIFSGFSDPCYADTVLDDTSIVEDFIDEEIVDESSNSEYVVLENKTKDDDSLNQEVSVFENDTVFEENKKLFVEDYKNFEEHKILVVTDKVDENGNSLKGAVLQILNFNGEIVDEWISDGSEHISMLPEGNYTLREKQAPDGYKISSDKSFVVKVVLNEINAGVDHDDSKDVCWHYDGVPLYYVESQGEKEEVYCVNQGWDEPNNTCYNGLILTEENLKDFIPDADNKMTNKELYDKILDIIYHRSKASEKFPELTETEIRYITEYALKNYTSAMVDDGALFRRYKYDPTNAKGHYEDLGNGDALGQLAKHWWYYHNKQQFPEVYALLYRYLINDDDPHPSDMYLYVYSTEQKTSEGYSYQNLLGIRWFDSYDDSYSVYLTCINELCDIPDVPSEKVDHSPRTYDDSNLDFAFGMLGMSALGLYGVSRKRRKN